MPVRVSPEVPPSHAARISERGFHGWRNVRVWASSSSQRTTRAGLRMSVIRASYANRPTLRDELAHAHAVTPRRSDLTLSELRAEAERREAVRAARRGRARRSE